MRYRVLCDENVEPRTVDELERNGITAVHVNEEPGRSSDDPAVATYARDHGYAILTNDSDFLNPESYPGITVLYHPDNDASAHDLARRVVELTDIVPDQDDLPRETFLTD